MFLHSKIERFSFFSCFSFNATFFFASFSFRFASEKRQDPSWQKRRQNLGQNSPQNSKSLFGPKGLPEPRKKTEKLLLSIESWLFHDGILIFHDLVCSS